MSEWTEIIDAVIDNLELMKELGSRTVELDPDLLQELLSTPQLATPAPPQAVNITPLPTLKTSDQSTLDPAVVTQRLQELAAQAQSCQLCPLSDKRTTPILGQGKEVKPDIMFIGDAPDPADQQSGNAFSGATGELLTRMINAMGYKLDEVFITNICKCAPPDNTLPKIEELQKCIPLLEGQIKTVQPKVIVLFGDLAARSILGVKTGTGLSLFQWGTFNNIPTMPIYHPRYILRFEALGDAAALRKSKLEVWNALKKVVAHLGRPLPKA